MRFGLVTLQERDPRNPSRDKRLTFEEKGFTNNTVVRLDANDWLFGERPFRDKDGPVGSWPGRWKERDVPLGTDSEGRERQGKKSVWIYDHEQVVITQTVEIVGGDQPRIMDTCLVRYRIDNLDRFPHRVGLRFMLDTYIGANDGVPFTIPGASQLCDTTRDFRRTEDVPDFIQALEHEDLKNPGTIARVKLRLGGRLELPNRVTLGAWPNPRLANMNPGCRQEKTMWEVPLFPIKTLPPGDSCVAIYWDAKDILPGGSRELGFAYGLGSLSSDEGGGELALTLGGDLTPGGRFTLTAYVKRPQQGQTLTLNMPGGFEILEGGQVQQVPPLPADGSSTNSPVTWKIKAPNRSGSFTLRVDSSTGVTQSQALIIRQARLFD
jgi:hypothetical protein